MRTDFEKYQIEKRSGFLPRMGILIIALVGVVGGCNPGPMEGRIENPADNPRHLPETRDPMLTGLDGGADGGTENHIWIEKAKLIPTEGKEMDQSFFGMILDMSGDTIVVGAYGEGEKKDQGGATYIYQLSDGTWTLEQKRLADDVQSKGIFGGSVAISDDTIAVGSFQIRKDNPPVGSVFILGRVKGDWVVLQRLGAADEEEDGFGVSLSMDGDTLAIGVIADDTTGDDFGSVHIYVREKDTWSLQQIVAAGDGQAEHGFGNTVDLKDDYLIVSAVLDDEIASNAGAAYIFHRSGDTWQEQTKLVAVDGAEDDFFGLGVAIDGDTAMVGAPLSDVNGDETGAVYVYTRTGGSWALQQKLLASDSESPDLFGRSVALGDGIALIGTIMGNGAVDDSGSAYVFVESDGKWTEGQKLSPGDGDARDIFGIAVCISQDTALIGAAFHDQVGDDAGAAYVYELSAPQGNGAGCSLDIQCESGFCVDGVCCNEACGGQNSLDCQACSVAAGASEDGVCGSLDGTICDDGDPETFDDICDMGTCAGTIVEPGQDTSSDTDTTHGEPDGEEDSDDCGCSAMGKRPPPILLQLLDLLQMQRLSMGGR